MFELDGVSKSFGGLRALDDITLSVPGGETTVLIGPSGCGKSTLIRLMIGLVQPDQGRVSFAGRAIGPDSAPALRRRMGYVIQDGGLFPHLTARQNVTLMARYLGHETSPMEERLDEIRRLTHFPEDGLDRYPVQLSGGQRQRVSLMRALMLNPDVLLLDEPLGALDPVIRHDLQGELADIFSSLGKTVVLVTHDIVEAGFFGDFVVLMRHGQILQAGSIGDLLERPADPFVERFVNARRSLPGAPPGVPPGDPS